MIREGIAGDGGRKRTYLGPSDGRLKGNGSESKKKTHAFTLSGLRSLGGDEKCMT